MAITVIAQPDSYQPAYNPIVYKVYSNSVANISELPGFKYVFGIQFDGETNQNIFKTYPDLDRNGQLDISKIIQSKIDSYLNLEGNVEVLNNQTSQVGYTIKFGEEYPLEWDFNDYSFSYFVQLDGSNPHTYVVGDQIIIKIDPSITDNRKKLNGTFNVVEVVDSNSIRINLLYTDVGDGPVTPGTTFYSDRRKESTYPNVTLTGLTAYNEAVPFKDFPTWTETNILPDLSGYPEGDILTNSPNWLDNLAADANKYIIKPYQELYWNAMNKNSIYNPDTTLANTMIVQNEFGDRWMLSDYSNWDDADIKMRQFNVSPNNPEWINITPNWGLGTFYTSGINPYTHINSDSSLSVSKWLEFWPTYAPGYDDCDAIDIEIFQDFAIPGPPSETFNFTFRPVVRGRNLRRIYHTLIDDKNAFLISEVDPGPQRVWNLYMQDNFSPYGTSNRYSAFAKRTSNTAPYGTTNASSNSADAWKAFDGNSLTFWETTDGLGTGTLTYNMPFDSAIGWARPVNYTINKGPSTTNAPKNWRFEASEDGTTWVTLHTVTNSFGAGTYTSPDLNISPAYTRFRIVVTATVLGFNVRINEFTVRAQSRIARMVSSNDCPTSGGVMFWAIQGGPIDEYSSLTLTTTAVLPTTYNSETDEFSTIPTLKKRRVYLDYTCQDNQTQILFLDRSGSWSSFAFPLKVNERMDNEKLNYRTNIGFVENSQWTYNTYDSEVKNYNSEVKKQYNITTNFMNKSMDDYFQELISSPVTYIKLKDSNDWLSCNILTKSLEPITRRLIQRTITIELNSQDNINI
jgi:hypothetical protein